MDTGPRHLRSSSRPSRSLSLRCEVRGCARSTGAGAIFSHERTKGRMSRKLQGLLTPRESVVALIDYQPQMFFGVGSHERYMVLNNALALAKAAKLFEVPVILTTVAAQTFSGALL